MGSRKSSKGSVKQKLSSTRKEVVIACVFVALAIIVFSVYLFVNREKHYNGDNVVLDFDPDASVNIPQDETLGDGEMGDFTGESVDNVFDVPEDAVLYDADSEPSGTSTAEPDSNEVLLDMFYVEDGVLYDVAGNSHGSISTYRSPNGDTVDSDGTVRRADGSVVGKVQVSDKAKEPERPSANQYVEMCVHYICGVDDPMFENFLSTELRNNFGQLSGVEPYASLNGVTDFKIGEITESTFSFTVGSTKYTFEAAFDNNVVIGLRYVQ